MTPIRNAAAQGKPDANQAEIVEALRAVGATVDEALAAKLVQVEPGHWRLEE